MYSRSGVWQRGGCSCADDVCHHCCGCGMLQKVKKCYIFANTIFYLYFWHVHQKTIRVYQLCINKIITFVISRKTFIKTYYFYLRYRSTKSDVDATTITAYYAPATESIQYPGESPYNTGMSTCARSEAGSRKYYVLDPAVMEQASQQN